MKLKLLAAAVLYALTYKEIGVNHVVATSSSTACDIKLIWNLKEEKFATEAEREDRIKELKKQPINYEFRKLKIVSEK